jgi:hypothetical protein
MAINYFKIGGAEVVGKKQTESNYKKKRMIL